MKNSVTRRDFFRTSAIAGLGAKLFGGLTPVTFAQSKGSRPLVVSSANGLRATAKAMEMIRDGKDTLDAVVAGVAIVEDDPKDMSVGYGGLPNEDGVVELDASVMHGPTKRAGAVASIQRIKNPAQVAKMVSDIESFTTENKALAGAVCFWRAMAPSQDEFAREGLRFLRKLLGFEKNKFCSCRWDP